ncbi:hypothetical protein HYDPIDRAFT_23218 [Hydnomerulius pinastri MD-312]|nr:hypothetical protein HYDPIDRAFT_23218 [Hydnomerulius pinastri MD-312]
MISLNLVSLVALALASAVAGGVPWETTPFNPSSVPLAVRTPYLSAWLAQGSGTPLNGAWPSFWTGTALGWTGYIRVDDVTYTFLGAPTVNGSKPATQKSLEFTSTQSTFVMSAGAVDLTVNILSPVEPTDLLKQSIPFSYMALSAVSTDGKAHAVNLYTDISAEWASGDLSQKVNWTSTTKGDYLSYQVMPENQQHTIEGAAYYATKNYLNATYQTGQDSVVRAQFISNGVLSNTQDTNFRAVNDSWPVFAFAHDLGKVGITEKEPVVFAIGHVRDPVVQYIVAGGAYQDRSTYFWSSLLHRHRLDYSNALTSAQDFDQRVHSDASTYSSNYAALAALSVRQAFGALELTISASSDGSWNKSDVLMFLKEISSDGVCLPGTSCSYKLLLPTERQYCRRRDARLADLTLYQSRARKVPLAWPLPVPGFWLVSQRLGGAHYPQAIGHNDGADEKMPLEECGNMLIMALSYTQKSGDNSLVSQYYKLLTQWTGYLVDEALIPADQISTDDFAGSLANQTNLAIKGVVGIKAMSMIAEMLGETSDAKVYSATVEKYVPLILQYATSADGKHLDLAYGQDNTWGLTYNLYADKLLGTKVFNNSVFKMQTDWYAQNANVYGIPLDTRHTYTKTDWEVWTASIMTDARTRNLFMDSVVRYAANGESNEALGDLYDTVSGQAAGFKARPVAGGHFALLASGNH